MAARSFVRWFCSASPPAVRQRLKPPVMGSAAFIMAEYTGIQYRDIAVAALLPAILYYVALFIVADLEAAKLVACGDPERCLKILRLHRAREFLHELG